MGGSREKGDSRGWNPQVRLPERHPTPLGGPPWRQMKKHEAWKRDYKKTGGLGVSPLVIGEPAGKSYYFINHILPAPLQKEKKVKTFHFYRLHNDIAISDEEVEWPSARLLCRFLPPRTDSWTIIYSVLRNIVPPMEACRTTFNIRYIVVSILYSSMLLFYNTNY